MARKILVVDDDVASLHAICRVFSDADDLELQGAANGEQALQAVHAWGPDLLLLDILMPGMDGYEVCRRIKADPDSAGTMVLLLSGRSALEDRLQGYAVQADDFIAKPYDPHELQAKVAILLRLRMAQEELRTMNRDLELLVAQKTRELVHKERQAVIGQMVQGIVHNLNGPLSGSLGFASLARDRIKGCIAQARTSAVELVPQLTTFAEYIERIVLSNENLRGLINSLLVKSRNEASLEQAGLAINEIITTELQFLDADMWIKHQIDKELLLADNIPTLRGVYADFSQIFSNLIRNAADAMSDTPVKKLTIRTACDGQRITVDFMDSGCGMEPAVMAKIFDPFFSTKAAQASEAGEGPVGTGLGLYTCAEIIRAYRGEITVSSQPGQGSCFTVIIPHAAVPA
jgi:signal transduction histidine kinase